MRGVEFYNNIFDQLLQRGGDGNYYQKIFEDVIGIPAGKIILSTAEHVAPFNLASTLSFTLPFSAVQSKHHKNTTLLVLAGSLIPLDNSHYPRGFVVATSKAVKINFYSLKFNKCSPLMLACKRPSSDLLIEASKLKSRSLDLILKIDFNEENYATQLCDYMEEIVSCWFDGYKPAVLVKPLESVAKRILIRLIEDDDAFVCRLLFESKFRDQTYNNLYGVFCAWGSEKGSFLFWAKCGYGIERLSLLDGSLVGLNVTIPLTKPSILNALQTDVLFPGVFLSLLMVSYLPGIPISGGPKQAKYYSEMIRAANEISSMNRSPMFAQEGYMNLNVEKITCDHGCLLPKTGTGLFLADNKVSVDNILEQIDQLGVKSFVV